MDKQSFPTGNKDVDRLLLLRLGTSRHIVFGN